MTCPICDGKTRIIDSRKDCDHVLRYRKCAECGYKFPTIEVDEDIYRRRKEKNKNSENNEKIKKCIAALRELTSKLNEIGDKND